MLEKVPWTSTRLLSLVTRKGFGDRIEYKDSKYNKGL